MVEERLDRALATTAWLTMYLNAQLKSGLAHISDHSPIFLHTEDTIISTRQWAFKFENKWLREDRLVTWLKMVSLKQILLC